MTPESTSNRQGRRTPGTRALLRQPPMNGWPLFWLLALPVSGFTMYTISGIDLASPQGVSHMIQYSVRWAVPFIYLVTAASAMPVLFPGEVSRWWLRNRRYLGLVFAVAMAWQGAFIFMISTLHSGYYYSEVYYLRDELEGSSGYIFLTAMVLTSFRFGRQRLTPPQWKILHRSGVYFLWAYPFSVYWWNLSYYGSAAAIDYIFYWAGFLAFAARIAAWGKKRRAQIALTGVSERAAGGLLILLGLVAAATGSRWQEPVSTALTAADWSAALELWLPFWPFQPFLPLFIIGAGTWLLVGGARVEADARRLA